MIKARTPWCVRNDRETHLTGVTGLQSRAFHFSRTPVCSRHSIHCLADQWHVDCDDDVWAVRLSECVNQWQGGLTRVWRNHGIGFITQIPSTKPYFATNRYDFNWYVWVMLHLCGFFFALFFFLQNSIFHCYTLFHVDVNYSMAN